MWVLQDIGPLALVRGACVVLTAPYVSHLHESVLQRRLAAPLHEQEQNKEQHLQLLQLQRQLRANFVHTHHSLAVRDVFGGGGGQEQGQGQRQTRGAAALLAGLAPLNTYFRRKRQNKRESKTLEKTWREKQGLRDGIKRRNNMAFSKAALSHRDEFLRFHRAKRSDCAKLGRAARQQLESVETKKEKQEGKAEARRLQALKENDMESYMALVQETKNSRLKHLLDQTDDYISTINRMVQAQRMQHDEEEEGGEGEGRDMVRHDMFPAQRVSCLPLIISLPMCVCLFRRCPRGEAT